ncbi:MAG: Mrp/NBP35 family ATP-binding protein [Candidatus Aphodosoma sp.]|nr:Mrp/NBP35 family ATP-binding protein [Candidatus Aphodosoma sp.]
MLTLYPNLILDALTHVRYPGTGKNIVEMGMIEDDIRIDGNKVSFSIVFSKVNDPFAKSVVKAAEQAILTYISKEVEIVGNISMKFPEVKKKEDNPLPGVKNIIAVSSGKGGVGKSTVAANLAMSLKNAGYKVGLLDADIFGPSIPKMFGIEDAKPMATQNEEGKYIIEPIEQYGIKILSIGFFVAPEDAIIWRGGMASNAVKQLINDANWGELDYFVVDLPPGTSDIHLTMVQTVKFTGAIVVSTPQKVALADAVKGIQMFENDKINVPILGLVENMAWFTPADHPDEKYYIFGNGGCAQLAKDKGVELLAQIPLVQSICESGDAGAPISFDRYSITGQAFANLAKRITEILEK